MKTNMHFWSYLAQSFLEWEIFQTKVVEKTKPHILCSVTFFFFRKSCCLWDNVVEYCRAGEATDDNMAHAHFTLDTQGYKHTLSKYVILIAFLLEQWLLERATMLRCTYVACLVISCCLQVGHMEISQIFTTKLQCSIRLCRQPFCTFEE